MNLSLNDLMLVPPNGSRETAVADTICIAKHVENLGFQRLLFAEHHAHLMLASCAPELLIPLVGAVTKKIKIGSGATLLNYYSPFKVAESYLALNDMFPGRVELGIGRSTSGEIIDDALLFNQEKDKNNDHEFRIKELLLWLYHSFNSNDPRYSIQIPHQCAHPNISILGSSPWSADIAAANGLMYNFADFLQPDNTNNALTRYFHNFQVSQFNSKLEPEAILTFRIICGKNEQQVRELMAPLHLMKYKMHRGKYSYLTSPEKAINELGFVPKYEAKFSFGKNGALLVAGTPDQIAEHIYKRIGNFEIKEIMFQDLIGDCQARMDCYSMLIDVLG